MAGSKTDNGENKVLDAILNDTAMSVGAVYLAMLTSDPTDTGQAGTEAVNGGYARELIEFDPAASGATANTYLESFGTASADWSTGSNITHLVITNAAAAALDGTNTFYHGDWDVAKPVLNGDEAQVAIGALDITES